MYASVEKWRAKAREPMAEWITVRQTMADLETYAVTLLAHVIDAYRWPEELPLPQRCDTFRAQSVQGETFGEDLTSEIAITLKTSVGAAERLVGDIVRLEERLPQCWTKVTTGEAELWQARKIVDACTTIKDHLRGHTQIGQHGLLPWRTNGEPVRSAALLKVFHKACREVAATIEDEYVKELLLGSHPFHGLRATGRTKAYRASGNLAAVQALGEWTNVKSAMRYQRTEVGYLREVVEAATKK
ncbi:MAG: hypothetical protein LBI33_05320 [Propionibacteriaceae bacterium]|jgi:hypothetical protein|nr:hypothetical protein [Propionibacteriaceae bacterium]